jgi:hypothetical protein
MWYNNDADETDSCRQALNYISERRGFASRGFDMRSDAKIRAETALSLVIKFLSYVEGVIHAHISKTWPECELHTSPYVGGSRLADKSFAIATKYKRHCLISTPPYFNTVQKFGLFNMVKTSFRQKTPDMSFQQLDQCEASFSWYMAKKDMQLNFQSGSVLVMCHTEAEVTVSATPWSTVSALN